jgi:hypothetical protein
MKSSAELVVGRVIERTLPEFEQACCLYIEIEQRQPTPDNALIAVLCDAVRLSRQLTDIESPSVIGRVKSTAVPVRSEPIDPDLFVTRVEQRRNELNLRNDELAGILGGVLLAVCQQFGIDALALVLADMETAASEQG